MKKFLADAYRAYRVVTKHRIYRTFRYGFFALFGAYLLTLVFPQYLFAHKITHKNFQFYAREPLDADMIRVLDAAEARLVKSLIYEDSSRERIFICDSSAF